MDLKSCLLARWRKAQRPKNLEHGTTRLKRSPRSCRNGPAQISRIEAQPRITGLAAIAFVCQFSESDRGVVGIWLLWLWMCLGCRGCAFVFEYTHSLLGSSCWTRLVPRERSMAQ